MRVATATEEGEDGRKLRGRDGASDSDDGEGEFDPGAPPPFGLEEIRAGIPKHCWVKDPWRSAGYVVRDVAVVLGLAATAAHLDSWAVWPLYWVTQGTMFWALFVLGHDCGHGSFSSNAKLNTVVGHFLHSSILVPYHGWRISHRTHHQNHGHVENDESWHPVSEDKLVLDIGRVALQHQDAKSYAHDLLLSMALAECSIAKLAFEKNKVAQGFEALARAQYFLKSKSSLEKMPLLSQIEESLEELAPACTLELLGMPQTPENGERRWKAIAALQELLRQGLEVEASCRVQDWPCFLSHALNRLMASEIVDPLSWDALATTCKNKKSLESQNQRIVIDFNCFYVAMIAHIALGFSTRQKDLVSKADGSVLGFDVISLRGFFEMSCSGILEAVKT